MSVTWTCTRSTHCSIDHDGQLAWSVTVSEARQTTSVGVVSTDLSAHVTVAKLSPHNAQNFFSKATHVLLLQQSANHAHTTEPDSAGGHTILITTDIILLLLVCATGYACPSSMTDEWHKKNVPIVETWKSDPLMIISTCRPKRALWINKIVQW